VLNNNYPASFFSAVSPWWVEVVSVFGGVFVVAMGLSRTWAILNYRARSKSLVLETVEKRHVVEKPVENDVVNAGRIVSRLVRNADKDLTEINPDFTLDSLKRLQNYLSELMAEIDNEEDARIRLGVVGVYLGETLCRNLGWQWFFRADPSLTQFSYLASVLRRQGKEMDPFAQAADLMTVMTGKRRINEILKEIQ
jgi:hypothetical protein